MPFFLPGVFKHPNWIQYFLSSTPSQNCWVFVFVFVLFCFCFPFWTPWRFPWHRFLLGTQGLLSNTRQYWWAHWVCQNDLTGAQASSPTLVLPPQSLYVSWVSSICKEPNLELGIQAMLASRYWFNCFKIFMAFQKNVCTHLSEWLRQN